MIFNIFLCFGSFTELNGNNTASGEWLTVHSINKDVLKKLEIALLKEYGRNDETNKLLLDIDNYDRCKIDAGISEFQDQDNTKIEEIVRSLLNQVETSDLLMKTEELKQLRKTLSETLPLELDNMTGSQLEASKNTMGSL